MVLCHIQVRQARRKKFNITDEERIDLEMDAEDLERELVTCKEYLDGANRAIEMLSSDIDKDILKYRVVAGVAAGVAAVGVAAVIYVGPGRQKMSCESLVTIRLKVTQR